MRVRRNLAERRAEILQRQREQRTQLVKAQAMRAEAEAKERQMRFARGLRGLWQRITGKHASIKGQNEMEALQAAKRDHAERDRLIFRHIEERNSFHKSVKEQRREQARQLTELHRDVAGFDQLKEESAKEQFNRATPERGRPRARGRERGRDFERD